MATNKLKNQNIKTFQKKAQISLFIIIGVLLLVVGIVYFIFSQTNLFQSPQAQSQEQISEILRFCVGEELKNSMKVLQFKGGRINAPPLETQQRVQTFDFDIYSWSKIPTTEEMELELKQEVEQKSIGCIASNLMNLNELYEITGFSQDLFQVDISITPQRITAVIEIPLNIKMRGQDESWEYSSLTLETPSALYTNFELAKAIFQEHTQNQIFEHLVLEQISMAKDYSDPRASVPTQGIQFSCNTPIFRASEIQNTILSLNDFNFNFLYFEGTASIENRFLGYDEDIREYYDSLYRKDLEFMNPIIDISRKEVDVVIPKRYSFTGDSTYLSSFREFRVNGIEEEFIRPTQLNLGGFIPMPCISVFSKVYDLDYDILVEIESFESGEFEVFRVPIRIQIEASEPKRTFDSSRSLVDSTQYTLNSQTYCSLEEQESYITDIILLEATNVGLKPLFNVDVSFSCAGIRCSDLGTFTNQLNSNSDSRLRANLPFCSSGRIIAQKEDFLHISTLKQAEELGFDSMCGESIVPMNDMIERGDFNGRIPYIDVCMIKLKEIELDINSMRFFDIQRGQTITNPQGELVVIAENQNLGYTTTGYFDFSNVESLESLKLPNVDVLNLNISIMYYEDNELLSYYEFENQEVELTFASSFFGTIPLMSSQIDSTQAFDSIESAYTQGYLDVNFGFTIN
ncbi:MAG: hypothetical protein LAT82_00065 [Nanoarchaeota archaeon]|nr:hypothetical protein [Nanoarchaeota archaeon]